MTALLLLGQVVLVGDYNVNLISTPESWMVFSKVLIADAFRSIYDAKTTSELYKKFFGEPEQIDLEASMEFRDETTITYSGRRFSVLWTAQEGGACRGSGIVLVAEDQWRSHLDRRCLH